MILSIRSLLWSNFEIGFTRKDLVMKRTPSWLVTGAMVAGLGVASFAESQDSFQPLQDPPKMTIGDLYQVLDYHDSDFPTANSTAVNRIMPSASQTTVRDGFRSNASDSNVARDRLNSFPNFLIQMIR